MFTSRRKIVTAVFSLENTAVISINDFWKLMWAKSYLGAIGRNFVWATAALAPWLPRPWFSDWHYGRLYCNVTVCWSVHWLIRIRQVSLAVCLVVHHWYSTGYISQLLTVSFSVSRSFPYVNSCRLLTCFTLTHVLVTFARWRRLTTFELSESTNLGRFSLLFVNLYTVLSFAEGDT